MGSQNPTIGDRTRMSWTGAMEQYFIDLMLDQLHRGNRLGHTFNKQAWTDMMNLFNAKFGTKCDRDVLKSHYSILWKQYNDVKNLLEQNGFYWDESRKMVIADGHIWDAYIKANPDVQTFRNRALMYFDDMCLIYGYTQADGRYSRSSHDIDLDDDVQVVHTGVEIGGTIAPESHEPTKRTEWTPAMDHYFVELMLDQLRRGSKRKNTFTKQAWKDMLILFNEKFCLQYRKRFLKHRYKKLFKYYADVRTLLDQKGFSWDEKQKIIVADDVIWDKYTKAHPHACSYRKKILLNHQDLSLIFANASKHGLSVHVHQDKVLKDDILQFKTGEENNHSSAESDSLRTCWTPPMDRYLVNLLLDQALRGNKTGLAFISEAWTEMVTMFNIKFGPQYDIDALKNRYKILRKQYNDINFLLEQSGFYWDDLRERVTAEDCVWDSYIKAYPDAQFYRNKSVPSYHMLCVIYGQESSNGRSSRVVPSLDLGISDLDLMIGEDLQFHAGRDFLGTDWTPLMDRYLIDLMIEHIQRGNRIGYTFNNEAWIDMAVSFVERFGLKYDKDLLRIHHKSLGKQYNEIKNLLGHRGFSWDERRQMVTAYGGVWDAYIKEHPNAKSYRMKPMPNYNDLCLIYGNSTSSGRGNPASRAPDCNGHGAKPNNGYCWSTDWTPPMDRYFIDLMLEQVRYGGMMDQNFSKLAWADMVAKFRAEFGSQYNKDVLKSRFMNLKKRFNDMKVLLDQNGFVWDEMRQMIIADPDLWDAYVKVYPDARPYRNRPLPNYNDLFLIYGNTNTLAAQNSFGHSMKTDYAVGVEIDDDQSPNDSGRPSIYWTKPVERYFINLMLEQVNRGNKIGHRFNDQAWAWMTGSFNEKFGLLCGKEVLEERYLSLMDECSNISDLLSENGYTWDYIQQTSIADDDFWEAHIKEHLSTITDGERSFGNYNDLCMIYGNKSTDGKFNVGVKIENDDNIFRDLQTPAAEFDLSDRKKKRKSAVSSWSCSRKVQRPFKEEIQGAVDEMPALVKTWAGSRENREFSSIEIVVDALQAIPGMDDELFLEACELLEDEKKAKMFIEMDVSQRRKWLLRKLSR